MKPILSALLVSCLVHAGPLFQTRPDFSGVWRLDTNESRMIGGGGPPSDEYQMTWLVNHRDPQIEVVVNVRNATGSREFAFRCTTDGKECVNELTSLGETRRMSAVWEGNELVMSQHASTPHGGFEAKDRLRLMEGGERLVFERVVTNERVERPVKLAFRKLGPHPSQRQPPPPLPTADRPPELTRVLRDYERHWRGGDVDGLVSLDSVRHIQGSRNDPGSPAIEHETTPDSSNLTSTEPPTFVAVGDTDRIAPPVVMERRVAALRRQGYQTRPLHDLLSSRTRPLSLETARSSWRSPSS